jgi:hypothetical protein
MMSCYAPTSKTQYRLPLLSLLHVVPILHIENKGVTHREVLQLVHLLLLLLLLLLLETHVGLMRLLAEDQIVVS